MSTYGRRVARGVLILLALAAIALSTFQIGWTVYGLLGAMPMDYIWGGLFIITCVLWVKYAKWLLGVLKSRREAPTQEQWYEGYNAKAIAQSMEQLEHTTQDWNYDTDKVVPGSAGAAAVGLDLVDEVFE